MSTFMLAQTKRPTKRSADILGSIFGPLKMPVAKERLLAAPSAFGANKLAPARVPLARNPSRLAGRPVRRAHLSSPGPLEPLEWPQDGRADVCARFLAAIKRPLDGGE